LARIGGRVVNHYWDEPECLEGVTGGKPRPDGAGRGMGGVGVVAGSGGGKINPGGWRGFVSSGCQAAIISQIHGFFSVGGGVG